MSEVDLGDLKLDKTNSAMRPIIDLTLKRLLSADGYLMVAPIRLHSVADIDS